MKRDTGKAAVLEQLLKTPIVEVACSKAGIGKTSFYEWKKSDPEFASAVEEAMKEGYEFVSDIAESQLISLIKKGNFSAVAYWLKHHRESYTTKVEMNGTLTVREELTEEESEILRQAFEHVIGTTPESPQ
jgi:hypothetical protein